MQKASGVDRDTDLAFQGSYEPGGGAGGLHAKYQHQQVQAHEASFDPSQEIII